MVSSALIYISIPSGAQFKYDYRLGQIWLEEDLVAPQDFVLQKSGEELESDRKFLIENKDFYYDYHYLYGGVFYDSNNRNYQWLNIFKSVSV